MDNQWHPLNNECDCFLCRIERDSLHYDPGYDAWSDSLNHYDGVIPEEGDPASIRADVLRNVRPRTPHRKSRQGMSESSARVGGGR